MENLREWHVVLVEWRFLLVGRPVVDRGVRTDGGQKLEKMEILLVFNGRFHTDRSTEEMRYKWKPGKILSN